MDGTTSGSGVHLTRVKTALLAEESQHMHQTRGTQSNNLPMSSEPPIHHANHLYGPTRHRCQCGRLKVEAKNLSQAQNGQTTYQMRASMAQLHGNPLRHCWEVHGPKRQCDQTKIEPTKVKIKHLNDKMPQEDERTYLGHMRIAQPPENPPKCQIGDLKSE